MKADYLTKAHELHTKLRGIDMCLKDGGTRFAELCVVTRSDLGQDFKTTVHVGASFWKPMLNSMRQSIVDELASIGVEV